jgi:hypothetical protein
MLNKAFVIVLNIIAVAQACLQTDTTLVNHTALIINVEASNVDIKHSVGGSVKITDGCRFTIRNLTIIPSGNGVYWWGVPVDNNTQPFPRVVVAAMGSYNGQTAIFQLDPQYSFDQISIMEMRSEGDNRVYGAWSVNGNVNAYYGVSNSAPPLDFESSSLSTTSTSRMFPFLMFMFSFTLICFILM